MNELAFFHECNKFLRNDKKKERKLYAIQQKRKKKKTNRTSFMEFFHLIKKGLELLNNYIRWTVACKWTVTSKNVSQ